MTTKQTPSKQPLCATEKENARHALRAIHEALVRMSGAIETMGEKTQHDDISPAGLFDVLRDSGQEAFGVGADAIDILSQILGVDVAMQNETGNPFRDAYRAVKGAVQPVQ